MDTQMLFQDLASFLHANEAAAGLFRAAIVAAQIGAGLLAFENGRGHGRSGSIGRHIRAETTLRQAHFQRTGGVTLSLRPKKREAFKPAMRRGFRPAFLYT